MNIRKILKLATKFEKVAVLDGSPDGEYGYHVTFLRYLPSIAQQGLSHGGSGGLGRGAHQEYSADKLFLTEGGGLYFWFTRMEEAAEDKSDNIYEDQLIPVVCRFTWPSQLEWDERGSEDSIHGDAFYTSNIISPDNIEIWNGSAWMPISDWQSIDPMIALDVEEDEEDGDMLYFFKQNNPLMP